jgi:hypothetical protein
MRRVGSLLPLAIVVGVAAAGPAVPARAGTLMLQPYEKNGLVATYVDEGPTDIDVRVGFLNVNLAIVNPFVTNFLFQDLRATSNKVSAGPGVRTHSGEFTSAPDCAGGTITIIATTTTDYVGLTNPPTKSSSASIDFHNAPAGSSLSTRSWFNQTNTDFATEFPPGGLTTFLPLDATGHASATATTAVPNAVPYGLTNRSDIFPAAYVPGMPIPGVSFDGTTTIVPAPSFVSMGLWILLPLLAGIVCMTHRRTES